MATMLSDWKNDNLWVSYISVIIFSDCSEATVLINTSQLHKYIETRDACVLLNEMALTVFQGSIVYAVKQQVFQYSLDNNCCTLYNKITQ